MSEAIGYRVQLDQTSAESSNVTGLTHQVLELLLEKWYSWRVSSCNADQVCDGPSLARRFFTGSDEVARYYYLTDHLGSVRATVKEDGTVVHFDDYYPFGMLMPGRSMETPEAPKERYSGKELDMESGLLYYGARYLDPMIARWMSVDPLAEKHPDWTPYNFVLGNPMLLIDPDGCQVNVNEALQFSKGAIKGAYNRVKGTISDVVTAVQTPEGRDGLLRSLALIAPAAPGDDRSIGEVYSDMFENAKSSVEEGVATLTSGSAEEIGTFLGAAAVTIVIVVLRKGKGDGKGLGANPFKGKTPKQIDKMLRDKGFEPRGPDPISGKGGYVNPESGYSYHIDPGGTYKKGVEKPHVDVNYPHGVNRPKKRFPIEEN